MSIQLKVEKPDSTLLVRLLVGLNLCLLSACGDGPSDNMERKLEHGHIEGAVNELLVGETLLRFSPDIEYSPDTNGPIVEGFADTVSFALRYPELNESYVLHTVYITVRGGWSKIPNEWGLRIEEENWRSVQFDEELGLTRYERQRFDGGWGFITFVTPEQSLASNDIQDSRIGFQCSSGARDFISGICMGSFVINNDLRVEYNISASMMEHWNVIHADVVSLISTIAIF